MIFNRTDGYSEVALFRGAVDHLRSAKILFTSSYPDSFFSAGYLCHLGIELVLKACCLYQKDQFNNTHDLQKLVKEIDFISIDEESSTLLEELDKLYELRYPISNQLKYRQSGQNDYNRSVRLINIISKSMPESLYKIYEKVFSKKP